MYFARCGCKSDDLKYLQCESQPPYRLASVREHRKSPHSTGSDTDERLQTKLDRQRSTTMPLCVVDFVYRAINPECAAALLDRSPTLVRCEFLKLEICFVLLQKVILHVF